MARGLDWFQGLSRDPRDVSRVFQGISRGFRGFMSVPGVFKPFQGRSMGFREVTECLRDVLGVFQVVSWALPETLGGSDTFQGCSREFQRVEDALFGSRGSQKRSNGDPIRFRSVPVYEGLSIEFQGVLLTFQGCS